MNCKRCGYILYSAENYCPHCGEKNMPAENENPEKTAEPTPVFTSRELGTKSTIFQPEPEHREPEAQLPPKTKSGKGAIALLSLVCVILLCVAAFMAMDYFDIAPAISDFLSPKEETTSAELFLSEKEFESVFGTVEPQINYTPAVCIVSSAKNISLRKGPADSFAQLCSLKSGCEVQVIGGSAQTDSWAYVYVPEEDIYGWLCTSFVTDSKAEAKDS